jgi:amino acid transporter
MEGHSQHHLSKDSLNFFDSLVMSVAGTAPAYSIAATTSVLVAAVGLQAPAALLWCGIPIAGVVVAFFFLNRWHVNSGASYAWVGKALNANLGFLSGWALIVSATVFMVSGSFPAGSATLDLIAPRLSGNLLAVTIVGALWFVIINLVVMLGIKLTAKVQWVMSSIEIGLLLIVGIVAAVKFGMHPVNHFSWSWFSPMAFKSPQAFIGGALIATFYYWGWDVSSNLNEETKNGHSAPGYGALLGVAFLFIVFEFFTVVTQMGMSLTQINNASSNILQTIGIQLFGPQLGNVMVLAVALSTIATLETSLLQITRTLFSMGRDGVVSKNFAITHSKWHTPYVANILVGVIALLLFVLSNFLSSVSAVLTDAINAIGLQVVFYYGLAAISVIVFYRRILFKSVVNFLVLFLWPLIAAIFLLVVGLADIPSLNLVTNFVGIGLIMVGIIPLLWGKYKNKSEFYYLPKEVYAASTVVVNSVDSTTSA